jgi:formyltetrahydrofolate-dependent phosphoribosylglycinamide formyltransferase
VKSFHSETKTQARVVVCASGEGTGFEAFVKAGQAGRMAGEVVGLIANRTKAGVLQRASRMEVPTQVLAPKDFANAELWDRAFLETLQNFGADWVVLAGFLARVGPITLNAFQNRIVNSHPALLPKYGGAGMYGERVHAAVLAAGEKESGVTIHMVNQDYDSGRILAQERLLIQPGETTATLSRRLKDLEHELYPRVLNDLIAGRLTAS